MADVKFVLFFVWLAAMVVVCWAVEAARMFVRRIGNDAHRVNAGLPKYHPQAAIILPIKGVEEDTLANVKLLLDQEYPAARFLFAVEAENDPAVALIQKLAQKEPAGRVEVIVAGIATERGQKVQNQLAAIERTTEADEVLVFMDADARPRAHWLRLLVGPLADPIVGATTGYRLYVPEGENASVATAMVSVINASIAALLGPPKRNHAWGGSMAIRRKDFFGYGVHDAWQHALSDDYVLSHCVMRLAKSHVQFVPSCLVASIGSFNWSSLFEFAARQYRITKVCAPGPWLIAILGELMYCVALVYPLALWIISVIGGHHDHPLLLMFALLYIANVIRGYLLLRASEMAIPRDADRFASIGFWYTWGYPLAFFVNLAALIRSAFGRTINWRGVRYRMISRTETIVERQNPVSQAGQTVQMAPQLATEPQKAETPTA